MPGRSPASRSSQGRAQAEPGDVQGGEGHQGAADDEHDVVGSQPGEACSYDGEGHVGGDEPQWLRRDPGAVAHHTGSTGDELGHEHP